MVFLECWKFLKSSQSPCGLIPILVFTVKAIFTFFPEESQINFTLFIIHGRCALPSGRAFLGLSEAHVLFPWNTQTSEQLFFPCTRRGRGRNQAELDGISHQSQVNILQPHSAFCSSFNILKGTEFWGDPWKKDTHR